MSIFNSIQLPKVKRNQFRMPHDRKFTCNMGELVPVLVLDCLPGDVVNIQPNLFLRFNPMIAPVMHTAKSYIHYFFVPNRILWSNWEKFITGGEDGEDASVAPYLVRNFGSDPGLTWGFGSLADYLGLPTPQDFGATPANHNVSAFPFAAYQKIWADYYRNQNLEVDLEDWDLVDGNNAVNLATLTALKSRNWTQDYFTSALPWTQRGPEALIPLTGIAPVVLDPAGAPYQPLLSRVASSGAAGGTGAYNATSGDVHIGVGAPLVLDPANGGADQSSLWADLSEGSGFASLNDLREAKALQEWLERNARAGSRYVESNLAHFQVRSSDQRLQRPEYVCGVQGPVKISEVLQTSASDSGGGGGTPQGNLAGYGVSVVGGKHKSYYCEEHGYIIGIMSIMPAPAYQQGVPRHFTRFDRFDYAWPEFANLGEQPILNKELYLTNSANTNEATFGYTPRYAEYKYMPSTVHADFRTSLDIWHMGRKFSALPALNSDFVKMNSAEVDRIFAVTAEGVDKLLCHCYTDLKVKRALPVYGTPKW